jgi:hypothetical protein
MDIRPRPSSDLTKPAALAVVGYLGGLRQGSQRAQATALRTVAEMLGQTDAAAVEWHRLPPAVLDSIGRDCPSGTRRPRPTGTCQRSGASCVKLGGTG